MKLVTAVIQPHRLDAVKRELSARDINRLTVTQAHGYGRQMGRVEHFRGQEYQINMVPKIELKIAVNDQFLEPCIEAIITGARDETEGGQVGDGKIFVTELKETIRISDGKRGGEAI